MSIQLLRGIGAAMLVAGSMMQGAAAHHSYAMFDKEKTQVIKGTLYAVEWKNPHSWIWIAVGNKKGGTDLWGLEGTSPASMTRLGFTKSNLVVGTAVTATLNPLKDGRMGGGLVELKFADGRATK
ncbi:MAG: DUF6152 family protein [Steroidobacteraceae bacterium]